MIRIKIALRLMARQKFFAFFYVGFLALLPTNQNVITTMTIGFFTGLLIDIFSNTPGIHASASVLFCFVRLSWLNTVIGGRDELQRVSVHDFGGSRFLLFIVPLVLLHHSMIFILENGSLSPFFLVFKRILWSTLLSSFLVLTSNFLLTNKQRRL